MKNNMKVKNVICIILTAILLAFTTNVYAANDSFKTSLKANKTSVKRGENVTVTIALSDISIQSGEKGIGAYKANIDFDSSVLEYVSSKGTDKWEDPFYSEKQITGTTNDGNVVNTNQNIGTITFKVKDDAKLGSTIIKLTKFSGSNAQSDITASDTSITITVANSSSGSGSGSSSGGTTGNGTTNGGASGATGTNGINGTNDNNLNNNDENISHGVLPQTGVSNTVIYILIIAAVLLAINFGIKIKLINKKINKK